VDVWIWWLFLALLFCVTSTLVGQAKGRGLQGFVLGFLLGPIGLIITAVLPDTVAKAAEKRSALAEAITSGLETRTFSSASSNSADERKAAMAEAIESDPSLGINDDPETLKRLRVAIDRILLDSETLRTRETLERERAEELARLAELDEARIEAEEQEAARELKSQEERDAKALRLAMMNPKLRFVVINQAVIGIGIVTVIALCVLGTVVWQQIATEAEAARRDDAQVAALDAQLAAQKADAEAKRRAAAPFLPAQKKYLDCYRRIDPSLPDGSGIYSSNSIKENAQFANQWASVYEAFEQCLMNYSKWPKVSKSDVSAISTQYARSAALWRQVAKAKSAQQQQDLYQSYSSRLFTNFLDEVCSLKLALRVDPSVIFGDCTK
jgi:hypothetical protein